jgi:hypothetical protein
MFYQEPTKIGPLPSRSTCTKISRERVDENDEKLDAC